MFSWILSEPKIKVRQAQRELWVAEKVQAYTATFQRSDETNGEKRGTMQRYLEISNFGLGQMAPY